MVLPKNAYVPGHGDSGATLRGDFAAAARRFPEGMERWAEVRPLRAGTSAWLRRRQRATWMASQTMNEPPKAPASRLAHSTKRSPMNPS